MMRVHFVLHRARAVDLGVAHLLAGVVKFQEARPAQTRELLGLFIVSR